ncbi:unnamed protein product, partial [Prorocentrum cordatum]
MASSSDRARAVRARLRPDSEPAWHRRLRAKRGIARVLLRLSDARALLKAHHSSGNMGKGGKDKGSKKGKGHEKQKSPVAHAWSCKSCKAQVSLNLEWCWQRGGHWQATPASTDSQPEESKPPWAAGDTSAGSKGLSPMKQEGAAVGPQLGPAIQTLQQAVDQVGRLDLPAEAQKQLLDPLNGVLNEVRAKRDAQKTPTQLIQASTQRLKGKMKSIGVKEKGVAQLREQLEAARTRASEIEEKISNEEGLLATARAEVQALQDEQNELIRQRQQPTPAPQAAAASFCAMKTALESMGMATAGDQHLVSAFQALAAAL